MFLFSIFKVPTFYVGKTNLLSKIFYLLIIIIFDFNIQIH